MNLCLRMWLRVNELISVIVPVYKVEQYLEKCVDSILAQTYTNLEIILVDDGSPDDCGKICDAYADQDSRIKVIHKENGGVSEARNTGLDIAKGEYIGFVDSDDWIEPNMYEDMLNAVHEYQADMSICCVEKIRKDKVIAQDIGHTRVYSRQKALYELICDRKVTSFSVNKLFHKDLFQNLQFQKGKSLFEDTLFMYQILEKITRAVHLNELCYHYLRRDDSALGTWPVAVEIESCLTQQERYFTLGKLHPELKPIMLKKYLEQFWTMRGNFLKPDCENVKQCGQKIKEETAPFFLGVAPDIQKITKLKWPKNINVSLFLNVPLLYRRVYLLLKRQKNH